jgi:hypothetical protein
VTTTKNVGEVAFLLGVPRRRVQWWIECGWLQVEPRPTGRGYYFRVSQDEIDVARRAVKHQRDFGVQASGGLFARMRERDGRRQPASIGQDTQASL